MSCQLRMLTNGRWTAKSKKTRYFKTPDGGVATAPDFIETFQNRSLEECAEFLAQRGVEPDEIDEAVVCMMKHDHNVAEFGIYGRFVFSKFEGVLH